MQYFFVKVLKKLSAFFRIKFLSDLYKNVFLFFLDKSIGSPDYEKYNHLSEDSIINRTIWVYWAQGLDNAPPVVQNCVKTLKENSSPDFVVQVVDDFNLVDYIDIPEIINTRLKEGVISRTHFSDIVRFELLKKHGGVWIDSTVLVAENFRGVLNKFSKFITLNHNDHNPYTAITEGRWTSFFIGMPKHSALADFMSDAFVSYWKKNSKLIDYVLVDYLIALAYKKIPAVQEMITGQNELIGNSRWFLQKVYDKKISIDIDEAINSDIYKIYKLTYKLTPPMDKDTYYYKFFCPEK